MERPIALHVIEGDPLPIALVPPGRPPAAARLPEPLTSFIGREREIAELLDLLGRPDHRLITLLGPGGVGKTRLAMRVAGDIARAGNQHLHFVPLAPVTDPAIVITSIGGAIGVSGPDDEPTIERVAAAIGTTETLLVLDNFERLVDAGPVLTELLVRCPRLTLLVTSRAILRLSGEHVIPVKPLATPPKDAPVDQITGFPSVQLFLERSDPRSQSGTGASASSELLAIVEICRRLDGLPLAIELAAARTRMFNASQLLEHLESGTAVLRHGPRDAPARLQSMQDMVAWSYDLLAEDEQAFLRLLSVFSGGFTFRAAAAIFGQFGESGDKSLEDLTPDWTGGGGDTFVADLLLSLIDQSLVEQTASDDSQPRFTLLETIREFARERLAENGETDRAFRLYAEWFAALARSRHPDLITTPKGAKHDPLFGEHDNVRAAIAWSIDHHEMQLAGWLACGLWPFCVSNGLYIEAGNVFDRVLSAPEALGPALHADLLHNAARCALLLEDIEKSQSLANSGISLYESLGNRYGAARCLCMIGMAMLRTEPARSASRWAAGVEILREIGETAALAYALDGLGEALIMVGDVEGAKSAASESAAIMHATGNRVSRFSPLGWAAIAEGDFDLAGKILREILEDWQYGPSPHNLADKLRLLGRVEFHCGNLLAAADHFLRALSISYEVDNALECAHCIAGMAAVAQADREPELAARWFGFDERRRQEGRLVLSPDEASARKTASDHALKALGASRFAAAWEAGTKLTMDEACEEVLAWRPSGRATGRPPSVLTRRESQVLTLLALGKTNSDIASELFVSTSTIDTHVSSILGKLGVTSRLAAVREAEKRGMLSE